MRCTTQCLLSQRTVAGTRGMQALPECGQAEAQAPGKLRLTRQRSPLAQCRREQCAHLLGEGAPAWTEYIAGKVGEKCRKLRGRAHYRQSQDLKREVQGVSLPACQHRGLEQAQERQHIFTAHRPYSHPL